MRIKLLTIIFIMILIIPAGAKTLIRIAPSDYDVLQPYFKSLDAAGRSPHYIDLLIDDNDMHKVYEAGIGFSVRNSEPSKADWLTLQEAYDRM
ncbi:MAG: hypothetical protein R6U31_02260, partial [bacterium]